MAAISINLETVRAEIAAACTRAGRQPGSVTIIAVTKSQGPDVLPPLLDAGVADFGENRTDHLELMHAAAPAHARFHAIGRVQSRQLARIVACCATLHSLCDESHVTKLGELCAAAGRRFPVFLQVNASQEARKAGMTPEAAPRMLAQARRCPGLEVVGLMTMAPEMPAGAGDDGRVRACFRRLAQLGRELELPRLSMGMSQDFHIAIEEGATEVRIGTRLFS